MPSALGSGETMALARRIVVAHRLPLRAEPDEASPFGFTFSLDPDALPFQLARGLPAPVTFVGTLPPSAAAAAVHSVELEDHLLSGFSCLPVFLPRSVHEQFYDGFCKHYLWPHLHYLTPISPAAAVLGDLHFDRELYLAFVTANRRFADRVVQVLSPDDGDLVVVHDYHLWLLPSYLRRKCPRSGVGFFLHSPFPSSEHFRSLPIRDVLLRALLNADLVGFHTLDYARHFLRACSRLLGASSRSRHGRIGIGYHGRTVLVKIHSVGVDMGRLRAAMASPEAVAKAREIADEYGGRALMVGVDDVDVFKGVSLKLLALEKLLETRPAVRSLVVLVQINNPARSRGVDVDAVRVETEAIRRRINDRFGGPTYQPVVVIDRAVPMCEKVAYYAAAECCVVSAVRDGLNRIPYFYTVCRQEAGAAADAGSAVVVSEFVGSSPSLGGALRVNPWNVDAVAEAMYAALTMRAEEKQLRHTKHYKYVRAHDVVEWARSFDADLRLAAGDRATTATIGMGLGTSYRVVAVDASFRKLTPEHVVPAYRASECRLILLDYDGTLVPHGSAAANAPTDEVIVVLGELCADPRNTVFLVSGRGKDELGAWFASCDRLGISAEHGYFTRWSKDEPWEARKPVPAGGFDWKETAESVMRLYAEATDGAYIEVKETAMVWHYQDADPELGPCQAKELLDHLTDVLAKEPVVVRSGCQIVEVSPQGVSKGVAVEGLLAAMARHGESPEFILCAGDDQSDEAMAESLARHGADPPAARVFACTVGNRPSVAKYYLDDPDDVVAMLRRLALAPSPPPLAAAVTFELGLSVNEPF